MSNEKTVTGLCATCKHCEIEQHYGLEQYFGYCRYEPDKLPPWTRWYETKLVIDGNGEISPANLIELGDGYDECKVYEEKV